ncbi:ESX secretion-associated protein EspG [Nocardia sp. NPDC003693]
MSWTFTPDEFAHIWRETRHDRYPFPLHIRTATRWRSDHHHRTEALTTRFPLASDPALTAALRTATHPRITLALTMVHHPLRAHAALSGPQAVTMVQHPTPTDADHGSPTSSALASLLENNFGGVTPCTTTPAHTRGVTPGAEISPTDDFGLDGGRITIESVTPARVPASFATLLGTVPAGRLLSGPYSIELDALAPRPEQLARPRVPYSEDRVRDLLLLPRTGQGHITSRRADRNPTATTSAGHHLGWLDTAEDGRYLYHLTAPHLHIRPCPPEALIDCLARMCAPAPE